MANSEQNDFSVVQSLFGIDPAQLARARQQADVQAANQEAARVAALPPQQGMVEQQLAGGAGVGRALAPAVQGALGIQQPVDPQMKFARTMQAIVQSLPQAGVDPSDPIAAQQYVGKALMQAGYPQQGMMALENARLRSQEQQKTQAEIAKNQAVAAKDLSESEPVARAFASGHISPQSYGQYIAGGKKDLSILQPTDKYTITQMGNRTVAVNKSNPNDITDLGEGKPGAGGDKQAAMDRFNTATQPYRQEDGSVDWASFQKADPTAANTAKFDARLAFGAANLSGVVGAGAVPHEAALAIAKGDAPWPNSRTPAGQALIAEARKINPNATADTFPTTQKTVNAFTSGVEGRSVRSFGVLQDHLGTLTDAIGDLKNGNGVLSNTIGNKIAEWSGKSAPTNFNAIKEVVADEVVKAVVGTVASEKDRQAIRDTIMNYRSPDQLMGAIAKYKELANAQLAGLARQYKAGTNRDDFETRILQKVKPPSDAEKSVLQEGLSAKGQGDAAYKTWWDSKSPEEKAAFRAAVAKAKGGQ